MSLINLLSTRFSPFLPLISNTLSIAVNLYPEVTFPHLLSHIHRYAFDFNKGIMLKFKHVLAHPVCQTSLHIRTDMTLKLTKHINNITDSSLVIKWLKKVPDKLYEKCLEFWLLVMQDNIEKTSKENEFIKGSHQLWKFYIKLFEEYQTFLFYVSYRNIINGVVSHKINCLIFYLNLIINKVLLKNKIKQLRSLGIKKFAINFESLYLLHKNINIDIFLKSNMDTVKFGTIKPNILSHDLFIVSKCFLTEIYSYKNAKIPPDHIHTTFINYSSKTKPLDVLSLIYMACLSEFDKNCLKNINNLAFSNQSRLKNKNYEHPNWITVLYEIDGISWQSSYHNVSNSSQPEKIKLESLTSYLIKIGHKILKLISIILSLYMSFIDFHNLKAIENLLGKTKIYPECIFRCLIVFNSIWNIKTKSLVLRKINRNITYYFLLVLFERTLVNKFYPFSFVILSLYYHNLRYSSLNKSKKLLSLVLHINIILVGEIFTEINNHNQSNSFPKFPFINENMRKLINYKIILSRLVAVKMINLNCQRKKLKNRWLQEKRSTTNILFYMHQITTNCMVTFRQYLSGDLMKYINIDIYKRNNIRSSNKNSGSNLSQVISCFFFNTKNNFKYAKNLVSLKMDHDLFWYYYKSLALITSTKKNLDSDLAIMSADNLKYIGKSLLYTDLKKISSNSHISNFSANKIDFTVFERFNPELWTALSQRQINYIISSCLVSSICIPYNKKFNFLNNLFREYEESTNIRESGVEFNLLYFFTKYFLNNNSYFRNYFLFFLEKNLSVLPSEIKNIVAYYSRNYFKISNLNNIVIKKKLHVAPQKYLKSSFNNEDKLIENHGINYTIRFENYTTNYILSLVSRLILSTYGQILTRIIQTLSYAKEYDEILIHMVTFTCVVIQVLTIKYKVILNKKSLITRMFSEQILPRK
jgi:hypothetical protein